MSEEATIESERELWRIADFCEQFGRSKSWVYDALSAGVLSGVRVGRNTLITGASVKRWREALPAYQSLKTDTQAAA